MVYLGVGQAQSCQIHSQQLSSFFGHGAVELFEDRRPPPQGSSDNGKPVCAQEREHATMKAAQVINALDQRVYGNLIFVMAMILRSRGRE
jgi:hypothetical protein